jgi:cobalt transporter subunit CbtA
LRRRVDPMTGLAFGAAAFAAFGLAPALGLPPELPGTAAAALGARQAWWAATAAATLAGLAMFFGCRRPWLRAAGLLLLTLPHLAGAPHPEVPSALAPEALQREFVVASLTASAVFWIALGGLTGFFARWFTLTGDTAVGAA